MKEAYRRLGWKVDCPTKCICLDASEERVVVMPLPYEKPNEHVIIFAKNLNCEYYGKTTK